MEIVAHNSGVLRDMAKALDTDRTRKVELHGDWFSVPLGDTAWGSCRVRIQVILCIQSFGPSQRWCTVSLDFQDRQDPNVLKLPHSFFFNLNSRVGIVEHSSASSRYLTFEIYYGVELPSNVTRAVLWSSVRSQLNPAEDLGYKVEVRIQVPA